MGERQDIPTFTRSVPASRVAGALEIFEDMVVFPSRQSRPPKFFALRAMIWRVYVSVWGLGGALLVRWFKMVEEMVPGLHAGTPHQHHVSLRGFERTTPSRVRVLIRESIEPYSGDG